MNKRPCIAITALVLGVALSSVSAFAQNGPGALNYGAGSNPQTGGTPYSAQPAAPGLAHQAVSDTNGPGGANFGAASNPQTGSKPYSAQAAAKGKSVYDVVPQQPSQSLGPNGPAGANFGAASNPQTGR
jgi:hypothetical protein